MSIFWKREKESLIKSTNFHYLQLTLHLVIVAILLEPLFEVVNLGGLEDSASEGDLELL